MCGRSDGHPEHVGAVVAAVGNEDRRPGVARHRTGLDQALVGVDGRAAHGNERRGVLLEAAEELIGELRQAAAARIGAVSGNVLPGAHVGERHVEMRAGSRPVGIGLGHHGRFPAIFAGKLLHHQPPHDEAVGHGHDVGIGEVELELAVGVLMIEGVHLPAELVHRRHDVVQKFQLMSVSEAS